MDRHPVDQALLVLGEAYPDRSSRELAELSPGKRDTLLLEVYKRTFGARLDGVGRCPSCREDVEFTLTASDLLAQAAPDGKERTDGIHVCDGYEVSFRLPTSLDLAAVAGCRDADEARRRLLQRCVRGAVEDGAAVDTGSLPESVVRSLAGAMLDLDPMAELQLDLSCPVCGQQWRMLLEIVSFLWERIDAEAKRLLQEVHVLARAHAWSEAEILRMSECRRRLYLEMVTG
jgi:hypothetical protein